MGIDLIIKSSLVRRTLDNVTAVLIAFQNFENYFNGQSTPTQKTDKNYKTSFVEPKSSETKKVETNYHSNKENGSFKLKDKFAEELDKKEKNSKIINTPQNNKTNNNQLSFNSNYSSAFKKGKDDSSPEMSGHIEKNIQSKLNINLNSDEGSSKNNFMSESKAQKDYIPSTTKNQKSASFKGELKK
jgi:hypothetical protein